MSQSSGVIECGNSGAWLDVGELQVGDVVAQRLVFAPVPPNMPKSQREWLTGRIAELAARPPLVGTVEGLPRREAMPQFGNREMWVGNIALRLSPQPDRAGGVTVMHLPVAGLHHLGTHAGDSADTYWPATRSFALLARAGAEPAVIMAPPEAA